MTNQKLPKRIDVLRSAREMFPVDSPEYQVLTNMVASLEKSSTKSAGESKAFKANKSVAMKVINIMPVGEPVTNAWVIEQLNDPNKKTAASLRQVWEILIDHEGMVAKNYTKNGVTYTRLQ